MPILEVSINKSRRQVSILCYLRWWLRVFTWGFFSRGFGVSDGVRGVCNGLEGLVVGDGWFGGGCSECWSGWGFTGLVKGRPHVKVFLFWKVLIIYMGNNSIVCQRLGVVNSNGQGSGCVFLLVYADTDG